MKKILFISTGGTIASTQKEEGMAPTLTAEDLISAVPGIREVCDIDTRLLMNIDSSNMQPEDWVIIAECIFDALRDYDGFVVAHGTDTMAYTASALSFMLGDLDKPVVLTGSQLSITDDGTDARINILDACTTASSPYLRGVFLVFNGKIILGCRASKVNTRDFQAFESINYPYIGTLFDRKITFFCPTVPVPPKDRHPSLDIRYSPDVALVKLYPGIHPRMLEDLPDKGYRAVIIEGFGDGGVPFLRRNLLPVVEAMLQGGTSVIFTTQCLRGGANLETYEVGQKALKLGGISARDMTLESIVTKAMWGLGRAQTAAELAQIFQTNYRGEISLGE